MKKTITPEQVATITLYLLSGIRDFKWAENLISDFREHKAFEEKWHAQRVFDERVSELHRMSFGEACMAERPNDCGSEIASALSPYLEHGRLRPKPQVADIEKRVGDIIDLSGLSAIWTFRIDEVNAANKYMHTSHIKEVPWISHRGMNASFLRDAIWAVFSKKLVATLQSTFRFLLSGSLQQKAWIYLGQNITRTYLNVTSRLYYELTEAEIKEVGMAEDMSDLLLDGNIPIGVDRNRRLLILVGR